MARDRDDRRESSLFRRIYCAGVFHNMVLVLVALIYLLLNPFFLRYFYTEAAIVSRVAKVKFLILVRSHPHVFFVDPLQDSPIRDLLPVHSLIQSIDACTVNSSSDWYQCLHSAHQRHPQWSSGYCLTQAEIQLHSSHIGRISKEIRLQNRWKTDLSLVFL